MSIIHKELHSHQMQHIMCVFLKDENYLIKF